MLFIDVPSPLQVIAWRLPQILLVTAGIAVVIVAVVLIRRVIKKRNKK